MKRMISLLLGLSMSAALALPAFAEPEKEAVAVEEPIAIAPAPDIGADATADARLKNVAELVKGALDLDTDGYTEFNGVLSEEELGVAWNLDWNSADANLHVSALDDGTIISYWHNDNKESYRYNPYLPTFPKIDSAAAKAAARAFLDRVLDASSEAVELEEPRAAGQLNGTSAYFSGNIKLNGLPSPLTYNITVRGSDNAVTNFSRTAPAQRYLGGVPSAAPAVAQSDAAAKLRDTLELELIYVTENANRPKEAKRAVLRYVVPSSHEVLCVDAQTGELVGADDMFYYTNNSPAPAAMEMAEDSDSGAGAARKSLNATELTGVDKLKDVLSTEQLDAKIRSEKAYMLDGYKIATSNYRLVKNPDKSENIYCTIRYTTGEAAADQKADYRADRTFYADARTGEVKSLNSYGRWDDDREPKITQSRAQSIAEDFLKRYTPHADALPLYDNSNETGKGAPSYGFTFTRKVNGYFYPENNCVIQIDCDTGAVCGLNFTWDDGAEFASADNLVSEKDALDAWMETYNVVLGYRSKSRKLEPLSGNALEDKLISLGYERFQVLFLSYGLERDENYPGIDAKTGKPVQPEAVDNEILYSDIDGTEAAAEIQKLADYGVGFAGGEFRPNISLTQWDAVCLIASSRGWRLNPDDAEDEEKNNVYGMIYGMGGLTPEERREDNVMTRGELVKLLLDCGGYRAVANLNGIFTTDFTDKDAIPAAEIGYAALAQGLGVVQGTYNAKETVRRSAAAVLLCRMMEREI
ncbi:MAG: S-layer homology domain-containing protein [Oscillibacter sp.]|nr:S-layer homology domain-containing protein [Oscillibacter sp.]